MLEEHRRCRKRSSLQPFRSYHYQGLGNDFRKRPPPARTPSAHAPAQPASTSEAPGRGRRVAAQGRRKSREVLRRGWGRQDPFGRPTTEPAIFHDPPTPEFRNDPEKNDEFDGLGDSESVRMFPQLSREILTPSMRQFELRARSARTSEPPPPTHTYTSGPLKLKSCVPGPFCPTAPIVSIGPSPPPGYACRQAGHSGTISPVSRILTGPACFAQRIPTRKGFVGSFRIHTSHKGATPPDQRQEARRNYLLSGRIPTDMIFFVSSFFRASIAHARR